MEKILSSLSSSELEFDDDIMGLSFGNLKMIKVVSLVARNICLHTDDISDKHSKRSTSGNRKKKHQIVSAQNCVVNAGLLRLIILATRALTDYEVHVNLYSAMA